LACRHRLKVLESLNEITHKTRKVLLKFDRVSAILQRPGKSLSTVLTVCVPSSRLINSFENVNPGINPLFFNQNIAAKDPEKKMPSTQAKPIRRVRNG